MPVKCIVFIIAKGCLTLDLSPIFNVTGRTALLAQLFRPTAVSGTSGVIIVTGSARVVCPVNIKLYIRLTQQEEWLLEPNLDFS